MAITDDTQFGRVGAFRFWCQKVLPAVYDDSLSYYELLCKVMHWLEELTEVTNTQSDAIRELQETLQQFMEGTFDPYIEQKIDEWFDDNEPQIVQDIADLQAADIYLQGLIDNLEDEMDKFAVEQAPNNELKGAKPIFRLELTRNDRVQGGCPFMYNSVMYYALCLYSISDGYVNRVVIINLANGTTVATITNNFGHGNMIDYYDGKIYISGDNSSTLVYVYDVSDPNSPTLLNIIDMSSYGFTNIWGFGHYKDDGWWATPDLAEIYIMDSDLSNKRFLCTQPINNYMTGTQQSLNYDDEEDVFYSCRSSSFTRFNENNSNTRYFAFDWQYGYCATYEIEQLNRMNGKLYFHNNTSYDAGDAIRVYTIFEYDPEKQCTPPLYIATRHIFRLKKDAQYKIPNFFNDVPTYFYYPEDLRTFLKCYHCMTEDSIILDTDIDFTICVPYEVGDINCNGHTCTGILMEGGNSTIIYGIPAYDQDAVDALTYEVNGTKALIHGSGMTLLIAGFGATEAAASATFHLFNVFGAVIGKRTDLPNTSWTALSSFVTDNTN